MLTKAHNQGLMEPAIMPHSISTRHKKTSYGYNILLFLMPLMMVMFFDFYDTHIKDALPNFENTQTEDPKLLSPLNIENEISILEKDWYGFVLYQGKTILWQLKDRYYANINFDATIEISNLDHMDDPVIMPLKYRESFYYLEHHLKRGKWRVRLRVYHDDQTYFQENIIEVK
jgi:hypothetical protein